MKSLSGTRGQMTIEMMLLILCLLAVAMTVAKSSRNQKWMATLVSGPWKPLKAMIEDGVWTVRDSKSMHPHHRDRHGSYDFDRAEGGDGGGDIE